MENLKELNSEELREIQGGSWYGPWAPVVGIYVLLEAALNPSAHIEAFNRGVEAGYEASTK
jgi:hypothetical protein